MANDALVQAYPWIRWNLLYKISQNTSYTDIVAGMKGKKICAYCDGWLALRDRKIYCLVNINLSKRIKLPPVNLDYTSCVLTCSPSNSSCRVLFMTSDTILCCQPGDKKYKTYQLEESMYVMEDMVAVVEGKVYYMIKSRGRNLVMIECDGSSLQFTEIYLGIHNYPEFRCYSAYLVESDGELLLVIKSYNTLDFRTYCFLIFRLDFSNKMWMKVDDIGKSTMFLRREGHAQGISFCASDAHIKQNSIYFLEHEDEDGYLHVYNLENQSFSTYQIEL